MYRSLVPPLAALLALLPWGDVKAVCPDTPSYGHHIYVGVDVAKPYRDGTRPEVRELLLQRVQLVWLPADPTTRYRDQYVIDIDWPSRTHTNVDIWDGELQMIRERDAIAVELEENTDFEAGQLHVLTCGQYIIESGPLLVFAHYGRDGQIWLEQSRVTLLDDHKDFTPTAVFSDVVSQAIARTFNDGFDQKVIEDVTLATGVQPGHFLAQNILIQNLEPVERVVQISPPLMFDPHNATIIHNQVFITGDNASASVPLSMEAVYSGDTDIMDGDRRIRDLENLVGHLRFESRFPLNGGPRYGFSSDHPVIEARSDLDVGVTPCQNGRTTITAEFRYPSKVEGTIRLYIGKSPGAVRSGPSIAEELTCDNDYQIRATRRYSNFYQPFAPPPVTEAGPVWIPLATPGTLIELNYGRSEPYDEADATPSEDILLKVWDVADIESLHGARRFYCDPANGPEIDSLDEIAQRRNALLSDAEKIAFGPTNDLEENNRAWNDGDGDGTVCDGDEPGEQGDGAGLTFIELLVYPNQSD